MDELHIVFDGPPGPEAGRFVEVETSDGKSINAGRWEQRGNYWHLIIRRPPIDAATETAKQRYDRFMEPGEEPDPIERLRFFCSLAMNGQDWLDVEPFFRALTNAALHSDGSKG